MMIDACDKEKILSEVLTLLSEKYPSGLYEWMYKNSPDTCREISELENKVNDNFRLNGSVGELKAILRAYWIAHMKAIHKFQSEYQLDMTSIREDRIEELEKMHTL